ncbi:gonadotropin-releasing hormone II receptor-like isoform X2 [Sceloporus undulatus]|nr:gonadotropin-releasing hormone II receptor-like isoform X2 [Sceloporus undulatus]XP_042330907.1 gonadotropin-releasing hormone II receptor-like isoform X2 [Sceloporus undulatus]
MTEGEPLMNDLQGCSAADENTSVSVCPKAWVEPTFTLAAKARVVVTSCFFVVAACSNWAVLYSVTRKRRKSHVQRLILSLTVADLLVTTIVMPLDAVWNITIQWYAGDVLCKLLNFFKLFAMYSAALVLVVISLDRHSAILHPFSFANSSHRNRIMLSVAWALSVLLASPQLFLFHLYTIPGVNFTQCVTHGSFRERWQETTYNMFTFTTLYITPLSVMVVCYVRILFEISKQLKINQGLARGKDDHISKARMKTLTMTILIVASFIICWTPYYLLGLWYWFQPDMIRQMPEYINHFLFLFGLLHTCTDPIIYGLYTPSFREDMKLCLKSLKLTLTHQEKSLASILELKIKEEHGQGEHPSSVSNGGTMHTVF